MEKESLEIGECLIRKSLIVPVMIELMRESQLAERIIAFPTNDVITPVEPSLLCVVVKRFYDNRIATIIFRKNVVRFFCNHYNSINFLHI